MLRHSLEKIAVEFKYQCCRDTGAAQVGVLCTGLGICCCRARGYSSSGSNGTTQSQVQISSSQLWTMQIHLGWQLREAPSGQELRKAKQGVGPVFYQPRLFTPHGCRAGAAPA